MSTDTHIDWDLALRPEVDEICQSVARGVAARYDGIEYADMLQEAYIAVATHPTQFQGYIDNDEMGFFGYALWQDVSTKARGYARYHSKVESLT